MIWLVGAHTHTSYLYQVVFQVLICTKQAKDSNYLRAVRLYEAFFSSCTYLNAEKMSPNSGNLSAT